MAVTICVNTRRYIGLSTDTKPTGVSVGSFFWEYDTGVTYATRDGDNWDLYIVN
jgi:hypothetical protein